MKSFRDLWKNSWSTDIESCAVRRSEVNKINFNFKIFLEKRAETKRFLEDMIDAMNLLDILDKMEGI